MNDALLNTLGAADAAAKIADGELSCTDLFIACRQRIKQHNPAINALVTLDLANAEQAARANDALLRAQGRPDSQPLLGVPLTVKDAFATQGLRTTSSFPPLANYIPTHDATLVARLKAAGAIVLRKSKRGFASWLASHRPALGGGAFTATLRGNRGVPRWFPSATPERLGRIPLQ